MHVSRQRQSARVNRGGFRRRVHAFHHHAIILPRLKHTRIFRHMMHADNGLSQRMDDSVRLVPCVYHSTLQRTSPQAVGVANRKVQRVDSVRSTG